MGFFEEGLGLAGKAMGAQAAKKRAKADRAERMALLEGTNFEPAYASDRAPTFQRSESPVARKYLESFLAGNNPAATFSGSPNAGIVKSQQRSAGNAMFGTDQDAIDRGTELRQQTPWKIKPASRSLPEVNPRDQQVQFGNPTISQAGLGADQADALKRAIGGKKYDAWMSKPLDDARLETFKGGVGAALERGASDEEVGAAFQDYIERYVSPDGKTKDNRSKIRKFFRPGR